MSRERKVRLRRLALLCVSEFSMHPPSIICICLMKLSCSLYLCAYVYMHVYPLLFCAVFVYQRKRDDYLFLELLVNFIVTNV
jgi:hypothetical protein